MTFKDLKEQSIIYVLDKNQVTVYNGKVISVKPGKTNPAVLGSAGFIMDFTIEYNGITQVFAIPDHLSVTYTGNNLILSVDQPSLIPELDKIIRDNENIVNNLESIKSGITKAKNLKMDLDPSYREKQQTEKRFSQIESSISEIKDMLQQLIK